MKIPGILFMPWVGKFGMNDQQGGKIADNIMPGVLTDLVKKTNDAQDKSIGVQGIFSTHSVEKTNSLYIPELFKKMRSDTLDLEADGVTDLQELMSVFSSNNGNIIKKIGTILIKRKNVQTG
jgi:hypothetical protein